MLITCWTSCASNPKNDCGYQFPKLPEHERLVGNDTVTVKDKDGNIIFLYVRSSDTVTVPFWYWQKILNYGIDTGGLK